jgi:hypothetical protein
METSKILYRLFVLVIFAVFAAIVTNIGLDPLVSGGSLAFAGLIGSLEITSETDTAAKVIFDSILEDWTGGAVLNRTRLKTDTTEILAGTLLYVADGAAEICKSALVITGGTATGIRVNKAHQFIVGEFVCIAVGDAAMPITVITTTETAYDTITIGTTLGVTPSVGQVLMEAAAQAGDDCTLLYTPNAILLSTTNVEKANPTCAAVVRGTVRNDALPYAPSVTFKAALPLIRFV